ADQTPAVGTAIPRQELRRERRRDIPLRLVGVVRLLYARAHAAWREAVRDGASAAERDRRSAPRARPWLRRLRGSHGPLASHARRADALAPRLGPRRDHRPDRRREGARDGVRQPPQGLLADARSVARGVPFRDVALDGPL